MINIMKHINEYNVIVEDYNKKEFVSYNVMTYLMRCYDETRKKDKPKTFEEFKEFFTAGIEGVSEEVLKNRFDECDANKDGKLDLFESIEGCSD